MPAEERKTWRYWIKTAEGAKLWFQNGVEMLNYVKGMASFEGGAVEMTVKEFKALGADPRP